MGKETPCYEQLDWCERRIAELEREVDFLSAFADPPDMQTGMTRRDELEQENERLRNANVGLRQEKAIRYRQGMERAAEIAETGEWNRGFEPEEIAQAISAEIKGTEK
jgi:hypothetical protein